MAIEFHLTKPVARVTATGKQPLAEALDVSAYDYIDAELGVHSLTGTDITVEIITGMQKDTESGWVPLLTFTSVTQNDIFEPMSTVGTGKMLKYIRWNVSIFTAPTAAVFSVWGMLRKN